MPNNHSRPDSELFRKQNRNTCRGVGGNSDFHDVSAVFVQKPGGSRGGYRVVGGFVQATGYYIARGLVKMFYFTLAVFASVACFGLGIISYRRHSIFEILLTSKPQNKKDIIKELYRITNRLLIAVGINLNMEEIDFKLKLAGRPYNLQAIDFVGIMAAFVGLVLVSALSLCLGGVIDPWIVMLFTFAAVVAPWAKIKADAERGRESFREDLINLSRRMEIAATGGLMPVRVLEWSAEGETLLARELKNVIDQVRLGKPLHFVFSNMAARYNLAEADELALVLKHAEKGSAIANYLRDLNRTFRNRKELELFTKASKLKPKVTVYLVLSAILTTVCFVVMPIILETIKIYNS